MSSALFGLKNITIQDFVRCEHQLEIIKILLIRTIELVKVNKINVVYLDGYFVLYFLLHYFLHYLLLRFMWISYLFRF